MPVSCSCRLGLFLLCRPEPLPSSPFDAGGDPLVAIAFRLFNSTADGAHATGCHSTTFTCIHSFTISPTDRIPARIQFQRFATRSCS